jgi:hypothetical protein
MSNLRTFQTPNDALVKKSIPYPATDLTISDLMDDEAQRCLAYVGYATGKSMNSLLSEMVKDWYDVSGGNMVAMAEMKTTKTPKVAVKGKAKSRKSSAEKHSFELRVTDADVLRARSLGIRLN